MLDDVKRFATTPVQFDLNGPDGPGDLQGGGIQPCIALAHPHERSTHGTLHSDMLTGKRHADVLDPLQEKGIIRRPLLLGFGHFVQQPIAAESTNLIFVSHPLACEFDHKGCFGQRRVTGREHVGEMALIQILYLQFGLWSSDLLGIIDEQSDDPRVVDVTLPKVQCEGMIPANLLGQLAQNCQADAEALEPTGPRAALLPLLNTLLVLIGFEESYYFGTIYVY